MNDTKRDLYFYLPDLPKKLRQKIIRWWKVKRLEELDYQHIEEAGGNALPLKPVDV